VVRFTADDPLKDPVLVDRIVRRLISHPELDYVSNMIEPTFPEGMEVEAFTVRTLERAWREAKLPSEREHVTPYIWKHGDRFRLANVKQRTDLSHMRWTVDYEADLRFVREIYSRLGVRKAFHMEAILELLKAEPRLAQINQGIPRLEGYKKSLVRDQLR
jgi:spore coat polysaccharide biosynthesis protein SpsF